jgi:hypothetical protein
MTSEEILESLDASARVYALPMLDNGYIFPVDLRMHVYRDDAEWLIILQELCVNNMRTSEFDSFCNTVHTFGSRCIPDDNQNTEFLYPLDNCPDAPLFDEFEWFARDDAHCVMLRGQRIELDLSPGQLKKKGITLFEPPKADPVAIMRSLVPEYRDLLFCTEAELTDYNPTNLPFFLRLDEWYHPNLVEEEWPSQTETFQMLAQAIVTGNKSLYRPTQEPNTHWKNWPEAGLL